MQPLVHIILILLAWLICLPLPRAAAVHVLTVIGFSAVVIFAPIAAVFLLLTVVEAAFMVWLFNKFPRKSDLRQYGPYLLLLNLLFVDFHQLFLLMPVATLTISFSTIRIFMTAKQLLSSRKTLPISETYWLLPAAFFLPALVIGPVFSGTLLRDQNRKGNFEQPVLRDYRMMLLGFLLAVLLSPAFGGVSNIMERYEHGIFFMIWVLLFSSVVCGVLGAITYCGTLFPAFWISPTGQLPTPVESADFQRFLVSLAQVDGSIRASIHISAA
nr:hypothetical protein [uncultured Roseovarius sp.]